MASEKTKVLESENFQTLVRKKGQVSAVLFLLAICAYFGFVSLLAFKTETLAQRLGSGVNLGIPLGIGVIIWSWILTGIYVRWANTTYDNMVEKVRADVTAAGNADGSFDNANDSNGGHA
jgi:uncharacterized membrane protein (DUF485 family)